MEKLLTIGAIVKSVLIVETIGLIVVLNAIIMFLREIP